MSPATIPTTADSTKESIDLRELNSHAFHLGLAIRDWDRDSTWMILRLMAPTAALDASEHPFKKPDMGLISFLFGFLAKAIDAADLHQARNTLSEMLRAAHLA